MLILDCATSFENNEHELRNSDQDFINGLNRVIGKQWLPDVHDQMRDLLRALSFKARERTKRTKEDPNRIIDWNGELQEYLDTLNEIIKKLGAPVASQ